MKQLTSRYSKNQDYVTRSIKHLVRYIRTEIPYYKSHFRYIRKLRNN